MGRKRREECALCGVMKTPENTYQKAGGKYYQNICKKCNAAKCAEYYVKNLTPEQKAKVKARYERLLKS